MNLNPTLPDLDEEPAEDDGGYAHASTFPRHQPNEPMRRLIDLVKSQGLMTMQSGSDEWRVPCPRHPSRGSGFNPCTVRLAQQANGAVWVHQPNEKWACSCDAEQIIAGFGTGDWRIVPAGTVPEPPRPPRALPGTPEYFLEATVKALTARGHQAKEHPDELGVVATCPVRGCRANLEVIIHDSDGRGPRFLIAECDRGHGSADVHKALDILSPEILGDEYGAANWTFDLLDEYDEPPTWAIEPIIEPGQFGSVYGPREVGKSLLVLDWVCQLARADQRRKILYLDHENPPGEIIKRVRAMGYTADDLVTLTYAHFPPIRALDTEAGAAAFIDLVTKLRPSVVILDTWSKFIDGDEASPTTHTRAYNLAIVPVRAEGVTVLAIDHAGKDVNRGPRGGSSKGDNVDVEWLLTAKTGGRLRLERKKSRTGRGPDLVELNRRVDPLRHDRVDLAPADVLSPDVRACVAKLDELDVPAGWGRERVAEVLRANEYKIRNATLAAALKVRRERGGASADSLDLFPDLGDSRGQVDNNQRGQARGQVDQ